MGRRCGLHACPGGLADLMENKSLMSIRNQPKLITLEPSGRIFYTLGRFFKKINVDEFWSQQKFITSLNNLQI